MLKVFHISDLHFDAEFSYLDKEKAYVRKNEIRLSFLSQIENAYDMGVRVFLIPGDIFDSRPYNKESLEFLKSVFEKFCEGNFFLCFGNHDYIYPDELNELSDYFGNNVYLFGHRMTMYEFDSYRVYGASFGDVYQSEPLMNDFEGISDEKINLMVLHGDLMKESKYNPVVNSSVEKSKIDYIALGHIHMYSGMSKLGNTYYCYPGTHEGKGFDELGEKGGVYLEIDKEKVRSEFVPGSKRKYVELHIDAEDVTASSVLIQKIVAGITDPKNLYKVVLEGEISENLIIDTNSLAKTLEDYAFFVKVYDETEFKINPDDYIEENSLLGGFVREVMEKLDSDVDGSEHWKRVLKKGFQLLK